MYLYKVDEKLYLILASSTLNSTKLRSTLKVIAWLPVIIFLTEHCCSLATISGRSMQPTFNPDSSKLTKDIILLNRYASIQSAAGQSTYKVGDVIALRSPLNPSTLLIKRIIALPGTIIETLPPYSEKLIRIKRGHCWIEGDDRFHSRDSNTFGSVPLGLIEGRVGWIVWPLSRFGPVKNDSSFGEKRRTISDLGNKKIRIGGRLPAYGSDLGEDAVGGR